MPRCPSLLWWLVLTIGADLARTAQAATAAAGALQTCVERCSNAYVASQAASLPGSGRSAGAACADSSEFVDERGYRCKSWHGSACNLKVAMNWKYSPEGIYEVRRRCPVACKRCTASNTTSALPPRSEAGRSQGGAEEEAGSSPEAGQRYTVEDVAEALGMEPGELSAKLLSAHGIRGRDAELDQHDVERAQGPRRGAVVRGATPPASAPPPSEPPAPESGIVRFMRVLRMIS